MRRSVLLFAFITTLTYSAQSQDFDYSFMETYNLNNQANLTVSSYNSDIEVIAHESDEIQIFYVVKKRNQLIKSTKEEIEKPVADQWRFDIEQSKHALTLKVLSTLTKGHIKAKDAIIVHFKIYVPKKTSTDLFSADGDILVQGLTLNQKCISSDGDIKLIDLPGKIVTATMDGDIILKNVTGAVDSGTPDGRVIDLINKKI